MADVDGLARAVEAAEDPEAALWELWGEVVAQACRTDVEDQADLVGLVVALRGRDDVGTVWDLRLWRDLPVLGAQLREAWSWVAPSASADGTWVRLNAFAARLTAAGYDSGVLGLFTLRAAVEEPEPTASDLHAARVWLDVAGEAIDRWSTERRAFEGVDDPGYSPERLALWRRVLAG